MRIVAIVQVRMNSTRLPGKVLMPALGKPMLQYLLESLAQCTTIDDLVVSTSIQPTDEPIAEYCTNNDIVYTRGPLDDVAQRFEITAREAKADAFVRISGDSPLLDSRIVDKAVIAFRNGNFDLVTNIQKRTFPKGQSVEVINTRSFLEVRKKFTSRHDMEHVTPYFYSNADAFNIQNLECVEHHGQMQTSVDTPEEMSIFKKVISSMDRPHWEYEHLEIAALFEQVAKGMA